MSKTYVPFLYPCKHCDVSFELDDLLGPTESGDLLCPRCEHELGWMEILEKLPNGFGRGICHRGARPGQANGKYKIEQRYIHGWDDAGWSDDEVPLRFKTRTAAEAALVEYFEQQVHVDNGDIAEEDKCGRHQFRVAEVNEDEIGR